MLIPEGASMPAAEGFFLPFLGAGDAVTVGGGGGGGSGAFDIEGNKVVRCGLMFGRKWLRCEDKELDVLGNGNAPAGVIYATVSHGGETEAKLSVNSGPSLPDSTLDASHRLLYGAEGSSGSKFWADYRSCITIMSMD